MYLQLLLLVITCIAISKCESDPLDDMTHDEVCEFDLSETIEGSLEFGNLNETLASWTASLRPFEYNETLEMYYHGPMSWFNTDRSSLPVSVKLIADNETVTCTVQDPFKQIDGGFGVQFYYQDRKIYQELYGSREQTTNQTVYDFDAEIGEDDVKDNRNIIVRRVNDSYPNFSIKVNRKLRKKDRRKGLRQSTLKGTYQCAIYLWSADKVIDSNAIHYRQEKASSVIRSNWIGQTLIGRHLKKNLKSFMNQTYNYCYRNTTDPNKFLIQSKMNLILKHMKLTEVRHPWNGDSKINFTLRYYDTDNKTSHYEAECRINDELEANIENEHPSSYAERVCFGVGRKHVGCYVRSPNSNQFVWNAPDQSEWRFVYNIRRRKYNRIAITDSGEQVLTLRIRALQPKHRRFWCEKTFIFGTLMLEHTFESNYLSKPEAEIVSVLTGEIPQTKDFERIGVTAYEPHD